MTPEAKRLLAEEGYDPAFGARPLKRSIQRLIQNPLAMAVLEGRFSDGDAIVVRPDGKGGLEFSNEPARETSGREASVTVAPHADDERWMAAALDEARAAQAAGEVPVGAVIVRGGEVLARAGNRTIARPGPDGARRGARDPGGGGGARIRGGSRGARST